MSAHGLRLAVLAAALATSGCTHFAVKLPAGFATLQRQDRWGYAFRAVTPDGVVLAVRDVDNEDVDGHLNGDLQFWAKAVSNRLRDSGGYALLEQREVTCAKGHHGVLLSYGHDEGVTPHRYQVAVFQAPNRLLLVEAGGEKRLFEAQADLIAKFFADFEVR